MWLELTGLTKGHLPDSLMPNRSLFVRSSIVLLRRRERDLLLAAQSRRFFLPGVRWYRESTLKRRNSSKREVLFSCSKLGSDSQGDFSWNGWVLSGHWSAIVHERKHAADSQCRLESGFTTSTTFIPKVSIPALTQLVCH